MKYFRIILKKSDISIIEDCSPATAGRRYKTILQALNKKPDQALTIKEYASFTGLDIDEVQEILKKFE